MTHLIVTYKFYYRGRNNYHYIKKILLLLIKYCENDLFFTQIFKITDLFFKA